MASFGYYADDDWCEFTFEHKGEPEPDWFWGIAFQSGAIIIVKADLLVAKTTDGLPPA